MAENFFEEQSQQSQIKAAIVSKYFWAWGEDHHRLPQGGRRRTPEIAYIDLFAGPGRYKDGAKSTPLLILEQAIADPMFRENLVDDLQRQGRGELPARC